MSQGNSIPAVQASGTSGADAQLALVSVTKHGIRAETSVRDEEVRELLSKISRQMDELKLVVMAIMHQ